MRQLTDASGTITLAKNYDPYGVSTQSLGIGATSYGYTGEMGSAGMVYLRARFYDPGIGRFMTRDTWNGDANQPMSYNFWAYVNGNPILFQDPTGMFPDEYADFSSENPKTLLPLDKDLISRALSSIGDAYERGYKEYVYSALLTECFTEDKLLALMFPNPGALTIFKGIHGGKIKFTKIDIHPGWWAEAQTKNSINLYKWGVLSNWETYQYMGGNIGAGSANPADKYLRFLAGKGTEPIDRANWDMVQEKYVRFITHETGHTFDLALKNAKGTNKIGTTSVSYALKNGVLPESKSPALQGGFCGTGGSGGQGWQWRLESQYNESREIFADMYIGWVYNCLRDYRGDFMGELMPGWIFHTYHHLPAAELK